MSLHKAALPSDPEALRAFAMALPAELYAKTLHLEKLKAQPVMLKRARYGHASKKLDGEIEQGGAKIAPSMVGKIMTRHWSCSPAAAQTLGNEAGPSLRSVFGDGRGLR
jgi:hypothetical protein